MTWLLLICLLVAAVGCLVASRFFPSKIVKVAAIGLFIASIIVSALSLNPRQVVTEPPLVNDLRAAIAHKLALEVARVFPAGGDVVILAPNIDNPLMRAATKREEQAVREVLQGKFNLIIRPVTLGPMDLRMGLGTDQFVKWLAESPAPVAVISFLSLPGDASDANMDKLPPFFASSVRDESYKSLVQAGKVRAVVLPREDAKPLESCAGKTLDQIFASQCRLVTPDSP
jgi:hypothetical protein